MQTFLFSYDNKNKNQICILCKQDKQNQTDSKYCDYCKKQMISDYQCQKQIINIKKCQHCYKEVNKLYCCKKINKCNTNNIYCFDCSLNHSNQICNQMNKCIQCNKSTNQLYICNKQNQCYSHLPKQEQYLFCIDCQNKHENKLCNKINSCIQCGKYQNQLNSCGKKYQCTTQQLYCSNCQFDHNNQKCIDENTCISCCQYIKGDQLLNNKICIQCYQQTIVERCHNCFYETYALFDCNMSNQCENNSSFCFKCQFKHENIEDQQLDQCIKNNQCQQCKFIVNKIKSCDQYNQCNQKHKYCDECMTQHQNKECDELNLCIKCNKEKARYNCMKYNLCTKYNHQKLFCQSCSKNHNNDICDVLNKCINCGITSDEEQLYTCSKNKSCTKDLNLFCLKCSIKHENKLCNALNICKNKDCNNQQTTFSNKCVQCDYHEKNYCSQCNEFIIDKKHFLTRKQKQKQLCKQCSQQQYINKLLNNQNNNQNNNNNQCYFCQKQCQQINLNISKFNINNEKIQYCNTCNLDKQTIKIIDIYDKYCEHFNQCQSCNNEMKYDNQNFLCNECVDKHYTQKYIDEQQYNIIDNKNRDQENCSICLESSDEFIQLKNCKKHHFHQQCLQEWIWTKKHQTQNIQGELIHDKNHKNTYFPCPYCKHDYLTNILQKQTNKNKLRHFNYDSCFNNQFEQQEFSDEDNWIEEEEEQEENLIVQ